jgi:hypothetical protein
MQPKQDILSLSVLMALASEQLSANGYRVVRDLGFNALPGDRALLAEDEYSVLAIVGYETWVQLEAEWSEAQAELVELFGRRLARSAPKAWDGYLLLLCTGAAPDSGAISQIERDTTRIRKIVAAADTLRTTMDLTRILDVFMPLSIQESTVALPNVLDALPELLRDRVAPSAVKTVIEAFQTMEPPLQRLHDLGEDQ